MKMHASILHKSQTVALPVIGALLAMVICGIFIRMAGINALDAYHHLFLGVFGSKFAIGSTLTKTLPLLFCALAVAVSFKASLFSIGAEGQLYMGALLATTVGIHLGHLPGLDLVLALLAGFAGGALWGFIPGLLKARWGINEVIVTIMMNYIAGYITAYVVSGPLNDSITLFPQSLPIANTAMLPIVLKGTTVHAGVILGLLMVLAIFILFAYTTFGYKLRAVGKNATASRVGGIPVKATIIVTMMISGGLAGLGGASEILGVYGRLTEGFSPGYGYLAIAVALLGRNEPLGTVIAALFFGALLAGANKMQSGAGVSSALVYVIQGLAVLFVICGIHLPSLIRRVRGKGQWR
jgi:ABC-type uncharacterized transport system permease subunit